MATKKVGPAGKFGARYGKKIRDNYSKFYSSSKKKYNCPNCAREKSVRRLSFGIWFCKSCNTKFASDAYKFE
ncbi:MAG: 50S ribosomal protein L37ae [Candidatus Aenigmarchaeota archaeon ex4484_56]|nr:MAG: 50S ribosomal protein L37ae [Candidatus Aenigmarchaeota archaeon ex4484_56]